MPELSQEVVALLVMLVQVQVVGVEQHMQQLQVKEAMVVFLGVEVEVVALLSMVSLPEQAVQVLEAKFGLFNIRL